MERRGRPKNYNRFQKLKKRYGLSPDDYADMLAKQKGVCAICGYAPSSLDKHLVVDHNHKSKAIRGLLCQHCNKGIGFLKDSTKVLKAAIKYLTVKLKLPKLNTRSRVNSPRKGPSKS